MSYGEIYSSSSSTFAVETNQQIIHNEENMNKSTSITSRFVGIPYSKSSIPTSWNVL